MVLMDLYNVIFFYIQNDFKIWYSNAFIRDKDCGQVLNFHNIDGPLCSYSHRPYKYQDDQCPLHNAIAYTFHKMLDDSMFQTHKCPAITKPAIIIYEK